MSKVNTINNLVEFNCILGTDVGIVKVLLKHYGKSGYFDIHYSTENSLKNKLLWRDNWNPITIMLKPDYMDSANDLYKEVVKKYEDEIYELSPYTDILRFMNLMQNNDDWKTNCCVNCKNERQKQIVKQISSRFQISIDQISMREYTTLFINEIENIAKYRDLGGKYIFISNYKFNLTEDFVPKPVIFLEGGYNKVRMIDPYKGLRLPVKNEGDMCTLWELN